MYWLRILLYAYPVWIDFYQCLVRSITLLISFCTYGGSWDSALLFDMAYGAFMEQRARKKRAREQAEANQDTDRYTQTGKLRKKFTRKPPTNAANGNGDTSQQAALAASRAAVRGASKKINYDALQVRELVYGMSHCMLPISLCLHVLTDVLSLELYDNNNDFT